MRSLEGRLRTGLLGGLFLSLLFSVSPVAIAAKDKNKARCQGTKKERKQVMELRDVSDEQFRKMIQQHGEAVEAAWQEMADTVLRRLEREYEEHRTSGKPFVYDTLVISGGGEKGAFGAGFLEGWGTVSGPMARPEFDAVTGVSTGALIAPFAFIGTRESFMSIAEFYANPDPNWVHKRGDFFLLPGHVSLFNDCRLQDTLRAAVDEPLVETLAQGREEDRLLLIGTTNLDAGRSQAFDLGREAQEALQAGSLDRISSILLASSAIPGVFPPMEIDGMYYADGGATTNLFVVRFSKTEGPFARFIKRHPDGPLPKLRIWVLVNQPLVAEPGLTQPRWISVASHALNALTQTAQLFALNLIKGMVYEARTERGLEAEFRIVSIPPELFEQEVLPFKEQKKANKVEKKKGMFDKELMVKLENLGRKMGADPSSWTTEIPRTQEW